VQVGDATEVNASGEGYLMTVFADGLGPTGAVDINPGDDWGTKFSGKPAGTTYNVKTGVHRQQNMDMSRDGDILNYGSFVRVTGGRLLTSWTVGSGEEYYVTGETSGPTLDTASMVSGWEQNDHLEDLFVDGTHYKQMAEGDIGTLNRGEWAWDDTNDRIYVRLSDGSDPDDGAEVEVIDTGTQRLSRVTGNNITWTWEDKPAGDIPWWALKNYPGAPVIEMYTGGNPLEGAVRGIGDNLLVEWINFRNIHGIGLTLNNDGSIVKHCRMTHNGKKGMSGSPTNYQLLNNEVRKNNKNHFSDGDQGGVKFTNTKANSIGDDWGSLNIVRGNGFLRNIAAVGFWQDIDCGNTIIEDNYFGHNDRRGLFDELSRGPTIIRRNLVEYNQKDVTSGGSGRPSGGQLYIATASKADIYGNVFRWNTEYADGVTLLRENSRESSFPPQITAITKADPAVCTAVDHGFETGKVIRFSSVTGMTELMDDPDADGEKRYRVIRLTADTFSLVGVNSTDFGVWSDSDHVREWNSEGNKVHHNIFISETGDGDIMYNRDESVYLIDADDDASSVAADNQWYDNVAHVLSLGTLDFRWDSGTNIDLADFETNSGGLAHDNSETTDLYVPTARALVLP
jgi:hypothetical protein